MTAPPSTPAPPPSSLSDWLSRRPALSSRHATLLVAIFLAFGCNLAFWSATLHNLGGVLARPWFLAAIVTLALCVFTILAALINVKGVFKPAVTTLLAVMVIVDYFALTHGMRLDAAMVQNTVETDPREVLELITPGLVLHVVLLGVVPIVLLARCRIRYRSLGAEIRAGLLLVLASLGGIATVAVVSYKQFAGFSREHPQLRRLVAPFNVVRAVATYVKQRSSAGAELVVVGADARVVRPVDPGGRPKVVVLVVGETARAASFSLNGYGRETNPELAGLDVISFTNVHACGTSTATALPCMFSGLGRSAFDSGAARHRENLLDVVRHAGIEVLWRENNSGCKHLCDRVATENTTRAGSLEHCTADECYDEVLLEGLADRIARTTGDQLIVLHQKGSHGPAYHLRYPASFRRFVPECATNDLTTCPRESIVNAYDNTIVYTDHVLARLIEILQTQAGAADTAMLYVSDHGESLGENNLYLHGLPYAFAPDFQIHVPMIAWLSAGFVARDGIDTVRLAADRDSALSHDNLFHSVLGLLDIETSEYRRELDLFARYRSR
jgi:lipid A ethanolaminephosphotransferase